MESKLKLVDPPSEQELTLSRLIARAQAQDKQAFQTLYHMHLTKVYGLCCRLCSDKSQAEDATQEVFIQLWQKIGNFKGDSLFSTWLHSVASNVTISYIRKQKGWWQKMLNIESSTTYEHQSDESICHSDLEKWIAKLPERARWVFVLHAIEGYRHEQIADMLGMAVGTSKAQFHRAKGLIEEWMDD